MQSCEVHRLVIFVDNYNDKRFIDGEGILYLCKEKDRYISYITNGLPTWEEGYAKKYLPLGDEEIKKYLEFGSKYSVLIDCYNNFKNRQVFGNGISMVFTKIKGDLLNGIDTFEISLGNVYFNREDYVNVVFKLGDKLEIDYEHSKLKLDIVDYEDKCAVIDEIVNNIYVNSDEICSVNDYGKKRVNTNVRKLLPNG